MFLKKILFKIGKYFRIGVRLYCLCVCVGFVRRGLVGVVNPLVRSPCKGCKEEGRRKGEYLGYLHDTGSNPVSVEQTLRVSSDLK